MKRSSKAVLIVAITLMVVFSSTGLWLGWFERSTDKSLFRLDTATVNISDHSSPLVTNADGTIHYLYDDFSTYKNNSGLVDGFANTENLQPEGATASISKQAYEGDKSLQLTPLGEQNEISLLGQTYGITDFSRWQAGGYLTMWLKITNLRGVCGITIQLGDASGAYREFDELPNLQTDYPDIFNKNDPFVDLPYPESTHSAEWTDFSLKSGWNFLPWRMDEGFYQDKGIPDFGKITWYKIIFRTKDIERQELIVDDLRVQDGLQKDRNPVNGNWYPPLGMPQYGVYDVDETAGGGYALKLQNVRQTQYASNGDHGRMLSKYGTPDNFAMRTKFEVDKLGEPEGNLTNTWLRIFYDFDPEYDPGHDWFGTYFSFDYKKMGFITVMPVERFVVQTQEPLESQKQTDFRKDFSLKPKVQYEYNLTVIGQYAKAVVYEVKGDKLYERASVAYTFNRPRAAKQYPLGVEITGNVKAIIYEFEVVEL